MSDHNIQQLDKAYVWHPYSPLKQFGEIIAVNKAEGALLYTDNHKTIIDAISSWWTNIHGHAHPYIATKLYEQALQLEHVIFAGFTHEPAVNLSQLLIKHVGLGQQKIFFSDNGSTAIEVAIKMALQYWHNVHSPKCTIIAFEHAYHGDTFGAMSVSARGLFTKPFEQMLFEVKFIPVPDGTRRSIEALQRIFSNSVNNDIAAFIYEPLVQGTAGMLMYDIDEMNALLQVMKDNDILLIADEVFTGFYRTGTLLAHHQLKVAPDLICLSKGLTAGFMPLGVTMCNQLIVSGFEHVERSQSFFHGHSYTGNPLACAVALASLELLLMPHTQENIRKIQAAHVAFSASLSGYAKAYNPRVLGTIAAIDFVPDNQKHGYISEWRDVMYDFFIRRGVLLRPLGTTIYTVPPYCISKEQLQVVYHAITEWFESN
jgi:adenosylmethionine-8-amino-7-oxononanoate aminotransferase